MNEMCQISKEHILGFVNENISVAEMAERLDIDFETVLDYYAELSAGARRTFPVQLMLTKSWLKQKLETTSIADICLETKVSPRILRRWAVKYGLEIRPVLKEVLSYEVLYSLFAEQRLPDSAIASKYSCSIETIKKLRKHYGITTSDRNDDEKIITIEYFHKLYVEYGFSVKQLIRLLDTTEYQIKQLISAFSSEECRLADEIKNRKKGYIYTGIIEELMKELEPALIYELLKTKTLTELAERYNIIPPSESGVETFSKEWLEVVLRKMDISAIMKKYHVGHYFISSLMKEAELRPSAPIDRLDKGLVRKLYLELHWDDEQIAAATGSSVYTIKVFRKQNDIKAADRLTLKERLPIDKFKNLFVEEGLTIAQIASVYKVSVRRVTDLKVIYSRIDSAIQSAKPLGVPGERIQFLKKKLQFSGMAK